MKKCITLAIVAVFALSSCGMNTEMYSYMVTRNSVSRTFLGNPDSKFAEVVESYEDSIKAFDRNHKKYYTIEVTSKVGKYEENDKSASMYLETIVKDFEKLNKEYLKQFELVAGENDVYYNKMRFSIFRAAQTTADVDEMFCEISVGE